MARRTNSVEAEHIQWLPPDEIAYFVWRPRLLRTPRDSRTAFGNIAALTPTFTGTCMVGEVLVEALLWSPLRGALHEELVEAIGAYGAYLGRPARLGP